MEPVRLRILGESLIEVGEWKLEPSASHVFALLLYLCIERGKLIPRSVIAYSLFPQTLSDAAAHNLRQLLYRLRRRGVPLVCTKATVTLPAERVSGAPEDLLTQSYVEALNNSSSRVLLPGYEPPTGEFSSWLENYRDDLTHKFQTRLSQDLQRARQGADWTAVKRFAYSLREIDPLNETATLGLAEALARTGSKQKAVQMLHDYAQDVGVSHEQLALPSHFLTRRISEESVHTPGASQIVGRIQELTQLTAGWAHARSGHCSVLFLSGEKLIGKSRVLEEFGALIRLDGTGTVLMLRPLPGDRDRPVSLFSDLCRQLLQLPGGAGCSPTSLWYIKRLIGASPDAPIRLAVDEEASTSEAGTRRAIIDLLDSVGSERPIVVCIDDAHHLDAASLSMLVRLPELMPATPSFFVIASAPGSIPLLDERSTLRLPPLSRRDAGELAERLCVSRGRPLSAGARDWCVSIASGNPGHLELLVEHASSLSSDPSIPPSLLALLDEKVQSLQPRARHVLQACAVFGADCGPEVISLLTGLDGYELLSVLESLVLHGFVTDSEEGIACRSSILVNRVANSTSRAVRSLLNRRAAEYLERLSQELPSQRIAWRIADHWYAAGNRARALRWKRVCWRQLISIGQPVAAVDSIRSALTSASSLEERARVLDELVVALRHASDTKAELSTLEERSELSDRIGDNDATRLALAADIAEARFYCYDDTTQLVSTLRTLLRAPQLDGPRRLRIARVLMVTADSLVSEILAREALEAVHRTARTLPASTSALEVKVIYHATFGDRDDASELADLLHASATQQVFTPARVVSHLTAALAHRIVDDRPLETSLFEELYERSVAATMTGLAIRIAARFGSMLFEDGHIGEAASWCARASELVERSGVQRLSTDYLTLRIDLALIEDDLALARRLVDLAPVHFPVYASPKWANAYHTYQTRIEQHEGHTRLSPDRLERMIGWHRRASHLGRYDDHMAVLWTALQREGRSEEASDMLRTYVEHTRRERRPCIYALRTTTAHDPTWAALSTKSESPVCSRR